MTTASDFADGLHALAEFIEDNPTVPLPSGDFKAFIFKGKDGQRTVLQEYARIPGTTEKHARGEMFGLKREFGGGVSLEVIADRDAVCAAKVVGQHVVPAQPERVVDDVEYVCGSLLEDS